MKNLVILRCGDNSLHDQWVQSENRNWDLFLCPYQPIRDRRFPQRLIEGQKWSGIAKLLHETEEWKKYDYIWFPDDDIQTSTVNINSFFDACTELAAKLAAPALTKDSFFSHPITLLCEHSQWRRTTFVELMIPCFSVGFLTDAAPTFELSRSGTGFGLESLWSAMLGYRDIYIIDKFPVRHTRPVGGFRSAVLSELAIQDASLVNSGMRLDMIQKTLVVANDRGEKIEVSDDSGRERYFASYEYLKRANPRSFERLRYLQAIDQIMAPFDVGPYLDFFSGRSRLEPAVISRGKPSTVSSVSEFSRSGDPSIEAQGGNDGKLNGHCRFHTGYEIDPWWQVDLESIYGVAQVVIYNRMDQMLRSTRLAVLVSDDAQIWTLVGCKLDDTLFGGIDGHPYIFSMVPPVSARFIRVQMIGTGYLHLDQIEVLEAACDAALIVHDAAEYLSN